MHYNLFKENLVNFEHKSLGGEAMGNVNEVIIDKLREEKISIKDIDELIIIIKNELSNKKRL